MIVMCCQRSTQLATEDHWFGLYKRTSERGIPFYWYALSWLDGNSASFRDLVTGFPIDKYANCVLYTKNGWLDKPCDEEHYYTCKKPDAGSSLLTISA